MVSEAAISEDLFTKVFDKSKFIKTIPDFTFSINGDTVTVSIEVVAGAAGYEVYRSSRPRGKYSLVTLSSAPVMSFMASDTSSFSCKVRAYAPGGEGKIYTEFSKYRIVDLLSAYKERDKRINGFFESIRSIGDVLSFRDLDIAIEALKVAGLEAQEKERKRLLEENAKALKEEEIKRKKRQEAARKRAETIREKKRIEHVREVTRMDLPMDYVNTYSNNENAGPLCESIPDALMKCIEKLGMVDIEYISMITGREMKEVIEKLRGAIYQNPLYWDEVFYKGWEMSDEYLSGNLMHKYRKAVEANEKYNGYFQSNVDALECLIDPEIACEDIYVTLGSPWVPPDVIDDFIAFMALGERTGSPEALEYYAEISSGRGSWCTVHDEFTGYWEIPEKNRFRKSCFHGKFETVDTDIYGTERMGMLYILENTLNMKTVTVEDRKDPSDKNCKTRVLNTEETVRVIEKQDRMIRMFQSWVWADDERRQRMQSAYCMKYGNIRKRIYDGSFLEFPGMSGDIKLYDYQKNAVARILFSPNTLLAHEVGSGKTYVMIAAGMELRRLGRSKKNLYVVPNSIVGQWEVTFRKMYPDADILMVTSRSFGPGKRSETLKKIRDEDHDAILMTYSCFDMLSLSDRYYLELYRERKELLEKAEKHFSRIGTIEKKRKKICEAIEKLQKTYRKKPLLIPFDELGINTLFVDEAHNFKNVDLDSRISGVKGMGGNGSARGNAMMDKVHCIQRHNCGGRIVFATGTPVTNSLTDIYVMQKYLQEGELEFRNILNFDSWAGMFAQKSTDFEIDVDTCSYHLVTRFSRFRNLPELASSLSSVADFHRVDSSIGLPELEGYTDCVGSGSEDFREYLREISNRVDDIRQKRVSVRDDNMLKITTDGRKAALDMRLIDTVFGLDPEAKVVRCAENVFDVYSSTRDIGGTQLVFCDVSTPKEGFNLYDELKDLLVAMGIKSDEIAFIHDAKTDAERQTFFKRMNSSELSVLIGSTEKMGHGVNVQKHLAAIHHLDVPWRPSDMVQREGRILRQGNECTSVRIFRYITRASFDAYSWQLLESKQRFIGQIMSADVSVRDGADVDDTVLNYAEVKSLAVGDPSIKRRVEVMNELDRLKILQNQFAQDMIRRKQLLNDLPSRIAEQKTRVNNCEEDIHRYLNEKSASYPDTDKRREIREAVYEAVQDNMNSKEDVHVLTYMGFDVTVPAQMMPKARDVREAAAERGEKIPKQKAGSSPYVIVSGKGSYYLEIGEKAGIIKRLNSLLEDLGEIKTGYEEVLAGLENTLLTVREEVGRRNGDCSEKIKELETELRELNEKLGVM